MKWYSYSKTAAFDEPRSVVHRCNDDCGGFEYEYCVAEYEYCVAEYEYRVAEYEYRVAEYDTNSSNQPPSVSSLLAPYTVRKTQTASVLPPHPPTPSPPLGGEGELRLNRVYP